MSLIEKLFKVEQKFSNEEAKGCEYISEKEAVATNPAPTGNVPNKGVENGILGATLAVGMDPLTTVVCWKRKNNFF